MTVEFSNKPDVCDSCAECPLYKFASGDEAKKAVDFNHRYRLFVDAWSPRQFTPGPLALSQIVSLEAWKQNDERVLEDFTNASQECVGQSSVESITMPNPQSGETTMRGIRGWIARNILPSRPATLTIPIAIERCQNPMAPELVRAFDLRLK